MSQNSIYFFILSFVLGVLFRSFFNFGESLIILLFFLATIIFVLKKEFALFSISLIIFSLGIIRMDIASQRDFILDSFLNEEIQITGLVVEEPSKRENSTVLVVKTEKSDEKILVTTERSGIFKYGDLISLDGRVRLPENFITENSKEFDYINYLSKDDIFYRILFPKIEILESGRGNFFREKLFYLKGVLISKISRTINSPESEYLGGLLFGVKESLGKELEKDFRKAGLIHVVVLSGYNVTIIAETILKSLSSFSKYTSLSLGAISIILFALMTGASATIVRASIMALLVILAKYLTRTYSIERSLSLAGFLMLVHNPKILVFDPSFQLSFLATLGLIYFSPIIYEKLKFLTDKYQIRELVSSTLSTQLFVLPLLLNKIGDFSIIAPLSNIIVLPFIPITMLFGFITSIVGLLSEKLATIPAFITYLLLSFQIKIVELFSNIPFSSFQIKKFPFILVITTYLAYYFFIRRRLALQGSKNNNVSF